MASFVPMELCINKKVETGGSSMGKASGRCKRWIQHGSPVSYFLDVPVAHIKIIKHRMDTQYLKTGIFFYLFSVGENYEL